jgi:hypothetical protein
MASSDSERPQQTDTVGTEEEVPQFPVPPVKATQAVSDVSHSDT